MIETDNAKVTVTFPNSKPRKFITHHQRSAIVAEAATGTPHTLIAQRFGVHPNSVSRIVSQVRTASQTAHSAALDRPSVQTKAIAQQISDDARQAIHASVLDRDDVHKAAGTGLSWLKGTGELNGDGATVNVFVGAIRELPADLRGEYLSIDEDIVETTATAIEPPQPVDE